MTLTQAVDEIESVTIDRVSAIAPNTKCAINQNDYFVSQKHATGSEINLGDMISSEPSEYAFSDPLLVELVIIDEDSASWGIELQTKSHEMG